MKITTRIFKNSVCLFLLALTGFFGFSQTTLNGKIADSNDQSPLPGASVYIQGTTEGVIADFDGNYSLTTSQEMPFVLVVSYTGYNSKNITVNSPSDTSIILLDEGLALDEVVISASRRAEKVQEAPASISVISSRALEVSTNENPLRDLNNEVGVTIQQQSAARINIEMRGTSSLFSTSVFPILDYRNLIAPGIGAFQSDAAGISNIDLARVEIVRGPGSALYGPNVTSGVVHFISKNPIDYPGTTVQLMGGELNTWGAAIRHATKVSDKFGFKINAHYKEGDEFTLDGSEGVTNGAGNFITQLSRFQNEIIQPGLDPTGTFVDATNTADARILLTEEDLDPDGDGNMMSDNWFNSSVNATLEFRPSDKTTYFLAGGFNTAKSVFYNSQGEGLFQQDEYWTQLRMQSGGFFGQVFYVNNNGGTEDKPTFLYQSGNRVPAGRKQLEGQLQYNFDTPDFLNGQWTIGADYRQSFSETFHLLYGRNEDDDDYNLAGAYLQGKFALGEKLDLVAAGRYDQFFFLDEGSFAPRVALVYKPTEKHTFRLTYNQASRVNETLDLNIDFPLNTVIPGSADIWHHGLKNGYSFNNPELSWFNGLIPNLPVSENGTPLVDGLPLAVPFALVNDQVQQGLAAALGQNPQLAPLVPIITGVLNSIQPAGTTGTLGQGFNLFDGTALPLVDSRKAGIATYTTYELGYKGLVGDKLSVSLDVYHQDVSNGSRFTAISPAYRLTGYEALPGDLGAAVGDAAGPALVQALMTQAGMPQAQAEGTVAALLPSIAGAYAQGGAGALATPSPLFNGLSLTQVLQALPYHATVAADQAPDNGVSHLTTGYRVFDGYKFTGVDLGVNYFVSDNLTLYGSFSHINKNVFQPKITGQDETFTLYLSVPTEKLRFGARLTPEKGFRGNLGYQYNGSFEAGFGQYTGTVQAQSLVDMGIGYAFGNGVSIDVSGTNIFNDEYRAFPNMPKIGRRVLGRLTYTFGGNN